MREASPRKRVLLVASEQTIAVPLQHALTRAGFDATAVPTGAQAIATARRTPPDLVLIEGRLPGGSSRAIYHRIQHDCGAAVVVLADSTASADRDDALDGADDYVVTPIPDAEAIARIRAVLRRVRMDRAEGTIVLGPLTLNPVVRRASLADRDLRLSRLEFALLHRLVRDAGTPVTRETLMRDVWHLDTSNGSSRTLPAHIALLRHKLGDDAAHPRFIHTVRGVGFRFASPEELAR